MQLKRVILIIATLSVAIGISVLWFSPAVDSVSPDRPIMSYAQIEPKIYRIIDNHGMHVTGKYTF
jgi:hypothetical protein